MCAAALASLSAVRAMQRYTYRTSGVSLPAHRGRPPARERTGAEPRLKRVRHATTRLSNRHTTDTRTDTRHPVARNSLVVSTLYPTLTAGVPREPHGDGADCAASGHPCTEDTHRRALVKAGATRRNTAHGRPHSTCVHVRSRNRDRAHVSSDSSSGDTWPARGEPGGDARGCRPRRWR